MTLVAKAAVIVYPPVVDNWPCVPCSLSNCVNQTNCPGGLTMDHCDCCTVCLKVQDEPCGGMSYRLGRCAHFLYCNITGPYRLNPIGHCVPIYRAVIKTIQKQVIPDTPSPTTVRTIPITVPTTISTLSKTDSRPVNTIQPAMAANISTKQEDDSNIEISSKKDEIPSPIGSTGSPLSNDTGGFMEGTRKNSGIDKDSEVSDNSKIDTMPALLFLATSGVLMALLVVLVTCFGRPR
ncbi:uncharacterized protein LOC110242294 isoform X2 [Exaiptasia diaphana]|nr:uncharacterized protein LOC110242294 isoform X2 [Exaiptasia diaphana]